MNDNMKKQQLNIGDCVYIVGWGSGMHPDNIGFTTIILETGGTYDKKGDGVRVKCKHLYSQDSTEWVKNTMFKKIKNPTKAEKYFNNKEK